MIIRSVIDFAEFRPIICFLIIASVDVNIIMELASIIEILELKVL